MSLFCPDKSCKKMDGAYTHEKWLISLVAIAIGVLAVAKLMHWF